MKLYFSPHLFARATDCGARSRYRSRVRTGRYPEKKTKSGADFWAINAKGYVRAGA